MASGKYTFMKNAEISEESLLSNTTLPKCSLTNGLALDLFLFSCNKGINQNVLSQWLFNISGVALDTINITHLITKLYRIRKKSLNKRGGQKQQYLSETFSIPVSTISRTKNDNETIYRNTAISFASELKETKQACERNLKHLIESKETVKANKDERKLIKKKLDRAHKSLLQNKEKLRTLRKKQSKQSTLLKSNKESVQLKKKVEKLSVKHRKDKDLMKHHRTEIFKLKRIIKQKQLKIDSLDNKLSISKSAVSKLSIQLDSTSKTEVDISALKEENQYLRGLIEDSGNVQLYDNSKDGYTPATVQCVMNLTGMGVASRNVGPAIKEVFKLCGKQPDRVPSKTTVERFSDAKVAVAQKQIPEMLAEKSDTTLMTDETSKYGMKYGTYIVSDPNKNSYLLELREMTDKSAATTLNTFREILHDISDACSVSYNKDNGSMGVGNHILANIRDTMSDRASTEKSFNELLEIYRESVFPDVIAGWEFLNEEEKKLCSKMNNFFCSLHLLVGMADTCSEALQKYSDLHIGDEMSSDSGDDSDAGFNSIKLGGAVELCRLCSKAMSRGGDEKSGCYSDWRHYITEKKDKVRFVRFHGNRFNILFVAAQTVYFHKEHVIHFLESVHGPTNKLLKIILKLIQNPVNIAGCRVLGLLSKSITSPFWRAVESCNHILDLNVYYLNMYNFLKEQSVDASKLLKGESPFEREYVDEEEVFRKLIADTEDDSLTIQIAQSVCTSLVRLLERMVKDHLPGGKFFQTGDSLSLQSQSVVPHNKLPEFVFGVLDRLMHMRPAASTLANEAYIIYSYNKTSKWLDNLPEDKRNKLLNEAKTAGRDIRKQFKLRNENIAKVRRQVLKQKQKELEERQTKQLKKKEELTNLVIYHGLWQSTEEVDIKLSEIKTVKEKREALESQLKFRINVLKQKHNDSSIFTLSAKGSGDTYKKHSLEVLTKNVKTLVLDSMAKPTSEIEKSGKPLLVGKKVNHTFHDGDYVGFVISVVPGYPHWYNIKYENDVAVYTYKLMDDYKEGSLRIIP